MGSLLDISASFIIGGLVIFMIAASSFDMTQNLYNSTLDLTTQEKTALMRRIMENEFAMIGFNLPDTVAAISEIDDDRITFRMDRNSDGVVEEVTYYIDNYSADYSVGENMLVRLVSGQQPEEIASGVMQLNFSYFDEDGANCSIADIEYIQYSFIYNSPIENGEHRSKMFVRNRIKPRNLK